MDKPPGLLIAKFMLTDGQFWSMIHSGNVGRIGGYALTASTTINDGCTMVVSDKPLKCLQPAKQGSNLNHGMLPCYA